MDVTLTKLYIDTLDRLVEEGIYSSRDEAVMEALRDLFRNHGLAPFSSREANTDTNQ